MRRERRAIGIALAAAIVWVAGCDQLFGIDERPLLPGDDAGDAATGTDSTVDAPGNDADAATIADSASQEAGGDGDAATAADGTADVAVDGAADVGPDVTADGPGADAAPCTGPTLYVSTQGNDQSPGCDPAKPKKSIAAAIAAAKTPAGVTTIEVCAGTYSVASLVLDTPASLLGGYDCAQWKRSTTYGYPTFDATNATTIQPASPSATGATLEIIGSTLGLSTVVDGFTILGQPTGTLGFTSAAVLVTGGASPTVSNDHLVGGGTTYSGTAAIPAAAGVVVDNGASPVIQQDTIEGGSGVTPVGQGAGSEGVYATGANGALTITNCTVRGGTGRTTGPSGSGSQGVALTGSTAGIAYTINFSTITGGMGSNGTCAVGCRATRGVYLDTGSATVVLDGNAIDGGDEVNNPNGSTTGTDCPHGVEVLAGGSVTATANRIYGGRCNLANPANLASLYGLFVGGGATLLAQNNMIHMGTSSIAHGAAAIGVGDATAPKLLFNTLIGGPNTGSSAGALWIQSGTTGAVVENNILAGAGGAPKAIGLLVSCSADAGPPIVASFQNNLVFATTGGVMEWQNCSSQAYATMDAATAELNSIVPGSAAGNFTLAASCGTDSRCLTYAGCTSQMACLTSLFDGFDVAQLGYANLFPGSAFAGQCPGVAPPSGNGWPLAATPMPPCPVARSNRNTSVPKDIYGNCRSATLPTMGAAEFLGTCL
jgi:hypothetical protein